ncbi:hypothetical protein C7H19_03685 [Aphanothece hegewaldii CCALA 016]|uniref:Uncharacterized protein n=1 Tax=Aphanothece hegewaldii CCALA 016 TaxID=2107694 RepID=A0A2T1M1P1_9CHRO|nr:hypothetical protein C7H19_03685 [Aphanothece hegewaldii CCALA 016]
MKEFNHSGTSGLITKGKKNETDSRIVLKPFFSRKDYCNNYLRYRLIQGATSLLMINRRNAKALF